MPACLYQFESLWTIKNVYIFKLFFKNPKHFSCNQKVCNTGHIKRRVCLKTKKQTKKQATNVKNSTICLKKGKCQSTPELKIIIFPNNSGGSNCVW